MSIELRLLDYNYVFDPSVAITSSTEDTEFPFSNLQKFHRSKVGRTTSTSGQWVLFDLKTTEAIDTFAMLFDKEAERTFNAGTTIRIQANATKSWTSPAVNVLLSIDEAYGGVSYFWSSNQSYRYWRLYIDDSASQLGYFEIPKVFLGKASQLSRLPLVGFEYAEEDRSLISETAYGHEYADTYPSRKRFLATYAGLTEADKQSLWEIYYRLGKAKPLLLAYDPTQELFTNKEEHLIYGFLNNDFTAVQLALNYFNAEIELREAL